MLLVAIINKKRLAVSLGLLGIVVVPATTGSLIKFVKHPIIPAGTSMEFDPRSITHDDIVCILKSDAESCEKARNEQQYPMIETPYPASLNQRLFVPVLRDVLLGALVPAVFVFLLPSAVRRYLRWLTTTE